MSRVVLNITCIWASDCVADLMLDALIACIIIPSELMFFANLREGEVIGSSS
jgi:hypothetical protein